MRSIPELVEHPAPDFLVSDRDEVRSALLEVRNEERPRAVPSGARSVGQGEEVELPCSARACDPEGNRLAVELLQSFRVLEILWLLVTDVWRGGFASSIIGCSFLPLI